MGQSCTNKCIKNILKWKKDVGLTQDRAKRPYQERILQKHLECAAHYTYVEGAFKNSKLFRIANFSGEPVQSAQYISGCKSETEMSIATIFRENVQQALIIQVLFAASKNTFV